MNPQRWRLLFLPALLLGVSCLSARAVGQEKLYRPEPDAKTVVSTFSQDWYGVYFNDKKIGYFTSKREKAEGGKVRDSIEMKLKIASFGKKDEMTLTQEMLFEEAAPYRLLRAESATLSGAVSVKTVVEKVEKGYAATVTTGKIETKKDLGDIDFTLADAMASELWMRGAPKERDTITYRDFSLEDLKVDLQTTKILERKVSLVKGVNVEFVEVETVSHRSKKLAMKTLHDEKGRLLSGTIAIFELRRETEAQAKNTEFSSDLFVLGQVKVDQGLGRPEKLDELVLEVLGKGGAFIPDGVWQKIENKEGTRILRLGKKHGNGDKVGDKDIKEALEETTALPITHEKVKELAKEAVGDAKTVEDKIKNLVSFTYKYIRPALTTDPPEIHHLMERKSGDCKCYARLFCVLARANGIPCREVSGFVYMGDSVKAFGGHAWNEVIVDGAWVPLDASMNRTQATVGHIFLGTERDAAGILETIGKLNFKLVEKK